MWSNIVNEGKNLEWAVNALTEGTAIWVTDESYVKEIAPDISGAGWILYCTGTKHILYGSFAEKLPYAGSYRGELLELLVIYTLVRAIEIFYKVKIASGKICCDNQGALHKSHSDSNNAYRSPRNTQVNSTRLGHYPTTLTETTSSLYYLSYMQ